jgi:hypothetical protein
MEGDLCERSLQFHSGVPCTTSEGVEARSFRVRMAEGRVDNVSLRGNLKEFNPPSKPFLSN